MDTDLSKIIRSNQYMTTGHIQFILYQILLAIKYMHSANVIHRDLKRTWCHTLLCIPHQPYSDSYSYHTLSRVNNLHDCHH